MIIIFPLCEYFTSIFVGGFSLKFEWQQVLRTLVSLLTDLISALVWIVSSCLLISSFHSLFFQAFGDCSKGSNYNWYHYHLPQPFQLSGKVQVFIYLIAFFYFHSVCWNRIRWLVLILSYKQNYFIIYNHLLNSQNIILI